MPSGRSLILVIDDDASVRKALRRLLRAAGYRLQTFAVADDLLKSDAMQHAACLIIDVGLPGMDGFALQQRLVGIGVTVPVIFISGDSRASGVHAEAVRHGAMAFLRKPFPDHQLLAAIEQSLAGRRQGQSAAE